MNSLKCPSCGQSLGKFYYADACPHCQAELVHNTRVLHSVPRVVGRRQASWPSRLFQNFLRFIES